MFYKNYEVKKIMAEAEELTQKQRAWGGGGQRSSLTKMIQSVNQLVKDFREVNWQEVKNFYLQLKEKMETLNKQNEQIFGLSKCDQRRRR